MAETKKTLRLSESGLLPSSNTAVDAVPADGARQDPALDTHENDSVPALIMPKKMMRRGPQEAWQFHRTPTNTGIADAALNM